MPTTFPAAFDAPSNPTLNTSMAGSGFEHDLQHVNLNDMVKAVQLRIGTTASPDTTSLTNQVNTAGLNITGLQGSVSTLNSQLGITNVNLTALTNTVSANSSSITNLIATKLNLAGGTMTGQLVVQYHPPAVSASSYVTSQLLVSNLGAADNPPQLGFQAIGVLGLSLYLNASGLNAITNLGGSSLIINTQGQLNALSLADGSLPASKIIPATITTAQLANNAVTKPIIAAGSIDASKFDATVMGAIQAAVGCPTATILSFGSVYLPSGWLPCDGRAVSRTTYANLFAYIGGAYGAGDGTTTFNLPDLRSRCPLGAYWNGSAWTAPAGLTARYWGWAGGEEMHTLSVAEMPSHAHAVYDPTHAHSLAQNPHVHGVADPGHAHSVYDPTHAHSVYDPGHNHWMNYAGQGTWAGGASSWHAPSYQFGGEWGNVHGSNIGIYGAYTGIGIYGAGTGIGIYGAYASLGVYGAYTGIGIYANGSDGAHNNMPPFQTIGMYIIKY